MSRRFDGIDDVVKWSMGGISGNAGWTFAVLLKFDAGVSWQGLLNLQDSGTHRIGCERHGGGGTWSVMSANGVLTVQGPAVSSADGWVLLAAARPAGSNQTVRFTKYPIGGSISQTSVVSTFSNDTNTKNEIIFGNTQGADPFDGWLAAAAYWDTDVSNSDVQSLVDTLTRPHWQSLSPVFLVDELDAFNTDYGTGGSTRTTLTGTTDDADDPTGWAFWSGEGPALSREEYLCFPKYKMRKQTYGYLPR